MIIEFKLPPKEEEEKAEDFETYMNKIDDFIMKEIRKCEGIKSVVKYINLLNEKTKIMVHAIQEHENIIAGLLRDI